MMAALERALVVRVAKGVPNRFTAPAVKGTRADIMVRAFGAPVPPLDCCGRAARTDRPGCPYVSG